MILPPLPKKTGNFIMSMFSLKGWKITEDFYIVFQFVFNFIKDPDPAKSLDSDPDAMNLDPKHCFSVGRIQGSELFFKGRF